MTIYQSKTKVPRKSSKFQPATLLKKGLWHRCFPVNFVKFLKTPLLQNTSGRLLLHQVSTLGESSYLLCNQRKSTFLKKT